MDKCAIVNFYIRGVERQFARRIMYHAPRVGDICRFKDDSYPVIRVEWCMDDDATERGVSVNVEMEGQ